jgi:hypothetical protein
VLMCLGLLVGRIVVFWGVLVEVWGIEGGMLLDNLIGCYVKYRCDMVCFVNEDG